LIDFLPAFKTIFIITGCFQNNFLGSQATTWKREQASRRGLLEYFSELVSDFMEASRNTFLNLHKKGNIVKSISAHKKVPI
jgi:hypothetical protein